MNEIPSNFTPINQTIPQLDVTKVQYIQQNYVQQLPSQPVSKLEEINKLLSAQLYQSNQENEELHKRLDDMYTQLRQLNDKSSEQKLYIKQLEYNFKQEERKRKEAEDKISIKDWKIALIAFISAITVLAIEHWKDIYNFILSLIELLQ